MNHKGEEMKKLSVLLIILMISLPCFAFIDRGWYPTEYDILDDNPNDEYNGISTNIAVRPKKPHDFNVRGCGIVINYGKLDHGEHWVNVIFKNVIGSYNPFELHKIKVIKPKYPPEWFIKKRYYWFFNDDGSKTNMWDYWEKDNQ